jgi:hypothetical protein
VRERDAGEGDRQIAHMREIGLTALTGLMHLFEDDILVGTMERAPGGDVVLEGP